MKQLGCIHPSLFFFKQTKIALWHSSLLILLAHPLLETFLFSVILDLLPSVDLLMGEM